MLKFILTAFISLITFYHSFAQQTTFKTTNGLTIKLQRDGIYINGKNAYPQAAEMDLLIDEPNRIIENGGALFLFVHGNGSPNLKRLYAFKITDKKVDLVADANNSEIQDIDEDSYLEFGGTDLTEVAPGKDSMYYIPSEYFEIRNGNIRHDSTLTINTDIRTNGIYLDNPKDVNGNCCKVIPIPPKLINPLIISERVDGPANVRDSARGTVILSLEDNVPVITAGLNNKWYFIGIHLDLSPEQYKSEEIEKGATLYVNGKIVGKAVKSLILENVSDNDGHLIGEVSGFTAMQNIRTNTLPEQVLAGIISQHTAGLNELMDFFKGYQFDKSERFGYMSYFLDKGLREPGENMRMEVLFENNKLFGILHDRKLPLKDSRSYDLENGNYFTVPNYQPPAKVMKFIRDYNYLMKHSG
ncbi:hypothetical protein [Chitinophaga sp.]|uniref:hypothetical protein n=1 Tax=Chitinophaga sp. TaxID=1869181 RepID=UPI0031D75806